MIRLGVGWGLLTGARGKRGDARGAYLQAKLNGPEVYVKIDARILPADWSKGDQYSEPVRRVYNSMYGLQRGSSDWGRKAHATITRNLDGEHIGDHGEGSLYALRIDGHGKRCLDCPATSSHSHQRDPPVFHQQHMQQAL